MIEANDLGEFEMECVDGDYAVLGRFQTDHVRGVDGNIIKDGVIYLAEKVHPHRNLGTFSCTTLGTRTCTIMIMIWESAVSLYFVQAKGVLRIMMGKIAVTSLGFGKGRVRSRVMFVWIIMGLAQIAIGRIGRSTSLEVIALLRLLRGIVTMRCWQRLGILLSSKL